MDAPPPPPPPPAHAWRLFSPDEWAAVEAAGAFAGSALDAKDGYIHLSLPSEVRATVAAYFAAAPRLVLAKVDLRDFAARGMLRMDYVASRAAFFPHVFDAARGHDAGPPPGIPLAAFARPPAVLLARAGGGGFDGWPEGEGF